MDNLRELVTLVVDYANLAGDLAHDEVGDIKAMIRLKNLVSRTKPVLASLDQTWLQFKTLDENGRSDLHVFVRAHIHTTNARPGESLKIQRLLDAGIELSSAINYASFAVKGITRG